MDHEKLKLSTTTSGQPPEPGFECASAPAPIDPATGMHRAYWVLSEAERAKGFVRPVRTSYAHVGIAGPKYPLRDLTEEEQVRFSTAGYVKFEAYSESDSIAGRFWTQPQLDSVGKGCGAVTIMGLAIAQTYARDPHYYGSTYCVGCFAHFPVGEQGEFVWDDDRTRVGS
jgi:hypothetical protein